MVALQRVVGRSREERRPSAPQRLWNAPHRPVPQRDTSPQYPSTHHRFRYVGDKRSLVTVARRHGDTSASLDLASETHGPDTAVLVTVAAGANAESAAEVAKALLLDELPAWLVLASVAAHPLTA